jgi:hypothetical protein
MVFPVATDPVIEVNGPGIVDLIATRFDGVIVHARRRNQGAPQSFVLASGFRSSPAVAAYGHGQLDLVALNLNGLLYHWRFINGAWSVPVTLAGSVVGTPVLKYTGAGQLELLTVGSDSKLYRRRFANGVWSGPQQLPSSFTISPQLFGPQSVSSWGDGSMDVVVSASGTAALYHRRVGPRDDTVSALFSPARGFNFIGGSVTATPALAALSPTRLHIVAKGHDGLFYNNLSSPDNSLSIGPITPGADPRMRWSGFKPIGGAGLHLGRIVKSGDGLIAAAIDSASRLYVNRFTSGAWIGFAPVIGVTPSMLPPSSWRLFRPTISAYGGQ